MKSKSRLFTLLVHITSLVVNDSPVKVNPQTFFLCVSWQSLIKILKCTSLFEWPSVSVDVSLTA